MTSTAPKLDIPDIDHETSEDTCGNCFVASHPARREARRDCTEHNITKGEQRLECKGGQPGITEADAAQIEHMYDSLGRSGPYMMPLLETASRAIGVIRELLAEIARRDKIDYARRTGKYNTPGMRLQRRAAESLCSSEDCSLSGGYAHDGDCEPCTCGLEHAAAECPADKVHAPQSASARSMLTDAQCGWTAGSVSMTFRGPNDEISKGVNCPGCLAVEAAKKATPTE